MDVRGPFGWLVSDDSARLGTRRYIPRILQLRRDLPLPPNRRAGRRALHPRHLLRRALVVDRVGALRRGRPVRPRGGPRFALLRRRTGLSVELLPIPG